jgi:hypothetical protein
MSLLFYILTSQKLCEEAGNAAHRKHRANSYALPAQAMHRVAQEEWQRHLEPHVPAAKEEEASYAEHVDVVGLLEECG